MRFSLSSSHALLEMKCDIQITYEMLSNAHVHQLTVSPTYACSRANHAHYSSVNVKFFSSSKHTLLK